MGLKVLQLSHNVPSSSQTLASAISSPSSSPSSKPRNKFLPNSVTLFGSTNFVLQRSRSLQQYPLSITRKRRTLRRAFSASLDSFSDEEFAKKIEDLALRFQISSENNAIMDLESFEESLKQSLTSSSVVNFAAEFEPPWNGHGLHGGRGEEIIPAIIERKANSVELPFSLRIIKEKLKLKEEFREVGESARCSVKKAFSSMVFIIRELQCFTLQMREVLFYEDLQGILERVQKEMHASFVWLFQQVFSHTPTLMVYVMILLANFTVHSMSSNNAIAAVVTPPPETSSIVEFRDNESRGHHGFHKFDSSAIKTFSITNGNNTASVDGGTGGGGKYKPVASGFDGDGRFDQTGTGLSNGGVYKTGENETESVQENNEEEETKLWEAMVEEASRNEVGLDHEAMKKFVSPVSAKIDSDDYAEYLRTELVYQTALSQEPNNVLLLANYAQFLYIVTHEFDRAEEYFKRAIEVEPPDAEAFNKYANFLWKVKNDLWAAEETYLEAISAEPSNTYYAANYAHFLWNTGGEDTCFPLSDDNSQDV
ncbi:unnamed protein product [Trifolium pratense]|uniref:Uncharacterized protein n=2 Tax=Trifolium pratense TaxID=57577 RepID=A0ACB0J848_TRIPR|nr:unnamed protein product [Trifolium pratense]